MENELVFPAGLKIAIIIAIIRTIPWKVAALWKAAQKEDKIWFRNLGNFISLYL